jgi:hypothetical protein
MLVWDKDGSIERRVREMRIEEATREKAEREERNRQIRIAAGYPADPAPEKEPQYDSPYAIENSTATFFYIVAMIVGTLFQDRVIIYTVATFIWLNYIMRHRRK